MIKIEFHFIFVFFDEKAFKLSYLSDFLVNFPPRPLINMTLQGMALVVTYCILEYFCECDFERSAKISKVKKHVATILLPLFSVFIIPLHLSTIGEYRKRSSQSVHLSVRPFGSMPNLCNYANIFFNFMFLVTSQKRMG